MTSRFIDDSSEAICQYFGLCQYLQCYNLTWSDYSHIISLVNPPRIVDIKRKVFNVNVLFWKYISLLSILFICKISQTFII